MQAGDDLLLQVSEMGTVLPSHPVIDEGVDMFVSATSRVRRAASALTVLAVGAVGLAAIDQASLAPAAAQPRSLALVGSLQSEIGCSDDWQPDCAESELVLAPDGTYSAEFSLPAGTYEYKVAADDAWDEAYGLDGGTENIPLTLAGTTTVRVVFDDVTHRTALVPLGLDGAYSAADDALVSAPARQPGSDEQFYFVLTDRFADGDPTNNTAGLGDDRLVSGYDPTDKGFYNGGDIAGLHANLDYIDGLGTTALWLTPSFKNQPVQGTGANASAGYHGYWITDFTQIDPHLGTNAELEALIDDAHARGIKVYFDIITNHTADVIDNAQGTYSYIDQATDPYTDASGTAFDPADFAGTGTFPDLDPATSFPLTPVVAPEQAAAKSPEWLNDVTLYHNRGNSTWAGESVTFGDFDGLDDLMTEHPRVVDGFVDVYTDWIDLGIDGFRIDTVKHVNFEFWETWTQEVLDYAHANGKPDFFMFGEVYDADAAKLSPYVRKTDMSSVLDFTFQAAGSSFAKGFTAQGLSSLFASDDMYTTPTTSADALPTFLGNHDMGRLGYMVAGSGSPEQRSALGHSLMYLTRGQPVVYYGDEQGFAGVGDGKDKNARQSLFGTEVGEYASQPLLDGTTLGTQDRLDTDAILYEHIAGLAQLRQEHPALSSGAQIERYAEDGAGVYAFSRVDRTEKVEHLVALNNAADARTVTLTSLTPGASFAPLYGTTTPVTADAAGVVTVTVPALGAVVLVADRTVAGTEAPTLAIAAPTAGAAVDGLAPVSATLTADRWAETSFAYRVVGDTGWTLLGTAEDTTPRVFHDTSALADGTLLEYRAVTTDAAGQRAAASTYASVGNSVSGTVGPVPDPGDLTVTVPGSHNAAMGCAADWDVACASARLTERPDGVYSGTFSLPAGSTFEYKVAIGGTWDVNYGVGGVPGGSNATYTVPASGSVTFYYDTETHYFTTSADGPIMTLPGSFQDQVGCAAAWAPDCMATWLQDLDGDGVFTYSTDALATGTYEVKVSESLSWDVNYGVGGSPGGANYSFTASAGKLVVFSYDPGTHVLSIDVTDPPLPGTGQARAHWLAQGLLAVPRDLLPVGADPAAHTWSLHHAPDGGIAAVDGAVAVPDGASLPLTYDPAGLPADVRELFPALADSVALRTDLDRATVEALLTEEVQLSAAGADGTLAALTAVQVPGVLDDLFGEAAADAPLGLTWSDGAPTFTLWAPTARSVALTAWTGDGTGAGQQIPMTRSADGTWSVTGTADLDGAQYLYDVEVYVPSTGTVEHNEVTDPYSVALTTGSTRSVAVDLADPDYQPDLWAQTPAPVVERPVDRSIYELHVRDFSIGDTSVPEDERGTYQAFTRDSDGMEHLRELASAGLNTVHLLPTFDIATIEEERSAQATTGDLTGFAPDSPEQQAAVTAVAATDGFNWGYDPYHFQVPEGSYATAAGQEGGARVAEFRSMVGALHGTGLQVVLDQVFNHTSASGQADTSVLDKVVPGYYHRLDANGAVQTSTCCQNVATEHEMAEKLMVDSVVLWARDYRVDGFRFDLMGHHSVENMLAVRAGLDELTLADDGVDGESVYLYGEGWNFGEVADNALFTQATQGQLGGTGIGTFSDRLRDAVHGGSPVDGGSLFQQGFGTGLATDPNGRPTSLSDPSVVNDGSAEELVDLAHQSDLVRLGLAGNLRGYSFLTSAGTVQRGDELDYRGAPAGYADQPGEVVSYVDAHDNQTLFDILTLKLPVATTMEDRVRMNTLSLSTTALSQTPSFWHAGTDLLRSKSLDRDSYNSGDWFNAIDWTGQRSTFGVGLPPEEKNGENWSLYGPLLADPALKPGADDMAASSAAAQDLLRLRYSTPLFRLGDAGLISEKVSFPGSGPDATPGVIVMRIDDTVGTDVDADLDGVLVVFNASPEPVTQAVDGLAGHTLKLSSVQRDGSDAVVRQTTWNAAAGQVTVPARSVAVLTEAHKRVPGGPGHGNPGHGNPGTGNPGHGNPGHGNPGHGNPGHGGPGKGNPGHGNDKPGKPNKPGKPGKPGMSVRDSTLAAGGRLELTASGFAAGETVQVWLHSTPRLLVAQPADADGAVTVSVVVPRDTEAGNHTVRLVGLTSGTEVSHELRVASADGSRGVLGMTGFSAAVAGVAAILVLVGAGVLLAARARRRALTEV